MSPSRREGTGFASTYYIVTPREARAEKTAEQIREIIKSGRSPDARSRRLKERIRLFAIIALTIAFLVSMQVCFGRH
jgi:hypothetical protein